MTGDVLIDNLISLVGVAVLVAIIAAVFGRARGTLTLVAAEQRLALDEPDFQAVEWLLADDAISALAHNACGELALVCVVGDSLLTRRFRAGDAAVSIGASGLRVKTPDLSVRDLTIACADAGQTQRWARLLRGNHASVH